MKGVFGWFKYILRREWNFLTYKKRKLLIFSLVAPILSFILIYGVFYEPVTRNVPIAVIDNDDSDISRKLITALNVSPDIDVAFEAADMKEAERLLLQGEIYGVALIPGDFSKKVLGYKGAEVPFYYNDQFLLLGSMANRGVISAVEYFSSKYNKVLAEKDGTPVYASAARAKPIIFNNKVLFNPYLNYQYFMLPGIFPAMLQIFIIAAFVYAFGWELKTGSAKEISSAAAEAPFVTIAAKSLPMWIIFIVNSFIMLCFLFVVVGVPLEGNPWTVILATVLFVLASSSAAGIIIFIGLGSLRMALSVCAVYAAPAFAYSGVTFPYMGMPEAAKIWAEILPMTHYHRVLINDALRGASHSGTPWDMLYLFMFFTVTFVIGALLYRVFILNPSSWGRQ